MHRTQEASCEFCQELCGDNRSRFHDLYKGILDDRTILYKGDFVAVPSMGQIAPCTLMLMPRAHVERFADLDPASWWAMEALLGAFEVAADGAVAIFEHGAKSHTGGACGIYHAHLHLVALPNAVQVDDLAYELDPFAGSLAEALEVVAGADEYLLLSGGGRTWTRTVLPEERPRYPSQYFRRVLAAACQDPQGWDWRAVPQPEPALLHSYHFWRDRLASRAGTSFATPLPC